MELNKEILFKEIFEKTHHKIHRLCLGYTGNQEDAQDLQQEIIIKVWNNLESFKSQSNINTWIFRIATNTALTFVGKRKKRIENYAPVQIEHLELAGDDEQRDPQMEKAHLYKAISMLEETDRLIISLLLEENSYQDIAEITGLKANHIGVKISRIKQQLKKNLEYHG